MFTNKKKKHFKRMQKGVEKTIWDLEFKRFKTLEVREGVREDYDNTNSKVSNLDKFIKDEEAVPTIEKGELARKHDERDLLKRDAERYKVQMDELDLQAMGSEKTNDYPDGVAGLNDQIDSLHELKVVIKNYIKNL